MATIHFMVRTESKKQLAQLYLYFVSGRESRIMLKTGYQVDPVYWSNAKEDYKDSITENGIMKIKDLEIERQKLINLRTTVLTEYNRLIGSGGNPSRKWMEDVVFRFNNPDNKPDKPETLSEYMDRFIREIESGERLTAKGLKFQPSTVKAYRHTKTMFEEFQGRKRLNYEDITIDLYNKLIQHFNAKNYSQNTIGKHIKILKVIMRSALEEGLHSNREFERRSFKVIQTKVHNVYLTTEEVQRLAYLDLSDNPAWDLARDIFLIGCHTAQRFSDYSRITPEMVRILSNGTKVIDLVQKKTGQKVTIPVKPELDIILKKYGYRTPHTWEQKVNQYIKLVAKMAKIDKPIQVEQSKGGLIVQSIAPKYELIKTHTARRTGCTLLHLAGIPSISIMKLSGHKTEKEFLKYINISEEENARILSDHPYFKKSPLKIAK